MNIDHLKCKSIDENAQISTKKIKDAPFHHWKTWINYANGYEYAWHVNVPSPYNYH